MAGYVCRKVQAKLKSSYHPHKEDMMLFISDFFGDEWDEACGTEEWTNAIDRGGLWHINDNTYTIFYLIEEEIRSHFKFKLPRRSKQTQSKIFWMLFFVMKI